MNKTATPTTTATLSTTATPTSPYTLTSKIPSQVGVFYLSDLKGNNLVVGGDASDGSITTQLSFGPIGSPLPLQLVECNSIDGSRQQQKSISLSYLCAIKILVDTSSSGGGEKYLIHNNSVLSMTNFNLSSINSSTTTDLNLNLNALFSFVNVSSSSFNSNNTSGFLYKLYSFSSSAFLTLSDRMSKNATVSNSPFLINATTLVLNPAWQSLGCWSDVGRGNIGLTWVQEGGGSGMSLQDCQAQCSLQIASKYAGLDVSGTCFCSYAFNILSLGAIYNSSFGCFHCTDSSFAFCGNSSYTVLDVYANVASSVSWKYLDCLQLDGYSLNVISTSESFTTSQLTNEVCISSCSHDYTLSGTLQGQSCSCISQLPSFISYGQCTSPCPGDSNEVCGGGFVNSMSQVSLYKSPKLTASWGSGGISAVYLGCWSDLSIDNSVAYTSITLTTSDCIDFCVLLSSPLLDYRFAFSTVGDGVCYCSKSFPSADVSSSSTPTKFNSNQCSGGCPGNHYEVCGGSLYEILHSTTVLSNQTCWQSSSSSFSAASSILDGGLFADEPYMSNELCQSICLQKLFVFAGTTDGTRCYCGNTKFSYSMQVSSVFCSTSCGGNSIDSCGGGSNSMSITSSGITVLPASYEFLGCWLVNHTIASSSTNNFSLATNDPTMTNEKCVLACIYLGYTFSATEGIGDFQCLQYLPLSGFPIDVNSCSSACLGNIACDGMLKMSISAITSSAAEIASLDKNFAITSVKRGLYWRVENTGYDYIELTDLSQEVADLSLKLVVDDLNYYDYNNNPLTSAEGWYLIHDTKLGFELHHSGEYTTQKIKTFIFITLKPYFYLKLRLGPMGYRLFKRSSRA